MNNHYPEEEIDPRAIAQIFSNVLGGLLASGHYTDGANPPDLIQIEKPDGSFITPAMRDADELTKAILNRLNLRRPHPPVATEPPEDA